MKKKNLALFDLDDTLFDGDTEGEWVKYMDKAGLIQDPQFFNKIESFGKMTLNCLEFVSAEPKNETIESRSRTYNWVTQAAYFTKPMMRRLFTSKKGA